MNELTEGVKLAAIWWTEDAGQTMVGKSGVLSIEIRMQQSHMNMVPWAMVKKADGAGEFWNMANADGCQLLEKVDLD